MNRGDIVKLDYDLYIKETGELYETTRESTAKDNDVYEEGAAYTPLIMVVEADKVIKGLEESLLSAEVGKDYEVELPPEKGYGDRDPKLVELHSMREIQRLPEFRDGEKYPEVGMRVTYKNRTATIARVTAGRVRLDFNHPLAGRTLKYNYKVIEGVKKMEDKVQAIVEMDYGTFDGFDARVEKDDLTIKVPEQCKYDQRWFLMKLKVVSDLREHTEFKNIRFLEEYAGKTEPAREEKPAKKDARKDAEGVRPKDGGEKEDAEGIRPEKEEEKGEKKDAAGGEDNKSVSL